MNSAPLSFSFGAARFAILTLCLVIAGLAPLQAQISTQDQEVLEKLEGSTLGGAVEAWYAAFRSQNGEDIRAMVEAHYQEELRTDLDAVVDRLLAASGARSSTPLADAGFDATQTWLLLGQGEDWVRFWFAPSDDDPSRFGSLGAQLMAAPPAPRLARSDTVDEFRINLDQHLKNLTDADDFSGTVYVARDGIPLFIGSFGYASRRYQTPNTSETRFNLGSTQKTLTALAVLRLVEDGHLELDATVGKYLPDYPNAIVREQVTIAHLLGHRSGLGTHFTEDFQESRRDRFRDFKDYFPLFESQNPAFEPGADFRYSNAGYFILGMIVESVTDEPFHDFLRRAVHAPAGIRGGGPLASDGDEQGVATGYYKEDDDWRSNMYYVTPVGTPAGGTYFNVFELAGLVDAWAADRIVGAPTREEMWRRWSDVPGSSAGYGLGTTIRELDDGRVSVGHSGGYVGVSSVLRVYPTEHGYDTVIVLSNLDGAAPSVARAIEDMLPLR